MQVKIFLFNPLYTNGFFLLVRYNKLGMVHCTYPGVSGYNFIVWRSFFTFTNSDDPDEMQHDAAFHLGLHCLQSTRLGVSWIQRVKWKLAADGIPADDFFSGSLWDFLCDICYLTLLITFANSLDPDQARQNVGHDLDPNCLTLWWFPWNNFSKKIVTFFKSLQQFMSL